MKILLTGGSGFIGSYLKSHLSKIHTVTAPSSKELNLEDYAAVKQFFNGKTFDTVIHAAGKGRDDVTGNDPKVMYNILTSFFNLQSNKAHFYKLINIGSGAEFGLDDSIDNVSEDDLRLAMPTGSYGIAKNYIAKVIQNEQQFFNLRVFACYGPNESSNRLLPKLKESIKQGKVFEISNDRYVDFVNVHDIAITADAVITGQLTDRDVNMVYSKKIKTSDLLYKYCIMHNVNADTAVRVIGTTEKNYTGNGARLAKYNLPFVGMRG